MTETTPRWSLTLYVSGAAPNSTAAIENVRRVCDEYLADSVDLRIIDVHDQPALVLADDVVAVPTMIKRMPGPLRQLVGDLSDPGRVVTGLDLPLSVLLGPPADEPGREAPGDAE